MRVYIEHINWPVFSVRFEFLICDCSSPHAQPFPGSTGGRIEHRGAGSYRRPTVAERQQLQRSCRVRGASHCAAQNDACKSVLCLCECWSFYKLNPCTTVFLLLYRRVENNWLSWLLGPLVLLRGGAYSTKGRLLVLLPPAPFSYSRREILRLPRHSFWEHHSSSASLTAVAFSLQFLCSCSGLRFLSMEDLLSSDHFPSLFAPRTPLTLHLGYLGDHVSLRCRSTPNSRISAIRPVFLYK